MGERRCAQGQGHGRSVSLSARLTRLGPLTPRPPRRACGRHPLCVEDEVSPASGSHEGRVVGKPVRASHEPTETGEESSWQRAGSRWVRTSRRTSRDSPSQNRKVGPQAEGKQQGTFKPRIESQPHQAKRRRAPGGRRGRRAGARRAGARGRRKGRCAGTSGSLPPAAREAHRRAPHAGAAARARAGGAAAGSAPAALCQLQASPLPGRG